MKKRAISFVLAALMLVAFAVPALAAEEKTSTVTVTTLVAPTYEDAKGFSEGLAAVKKNGKWGFIDETGKVVIDFKYDYAGSFDEGYAVVGKSEEGWEEYYTCYIVDKTGKETALRWERYGETEIVEIWGSENFGTPFFQNGVLVLNGFAFGTDGMEIVPAEADIHALIDKIDNLGIDGFSIMYGDGEKEYYYNYTCAGVCVDGLIPMYLQGEECWVCFLMDKTGHVVKDFADKITQDWDTENVVYLNALRAPVDGYMLAANSTMEPGTLGEFDTRYGVMDYATGSWVIAPKYTNYRYNLGGNFFLNGLWIVKSGDKFGAVNKSGTEVIPVEYDYIDVYNHGLAAACKDGKWFYLDTYGNRYDVGLPGGGTAKNLAITGPFSENGVAAVYDEDTGKGYLVMDTPVNGVLPAIEGSDGVALSTYFPGFDGTVESLSTTLTPSEIVAFEQNGKYGFYKLNFDLVGQNPFTDVLPGAYYFDQVVWAANEEIVDTSVKEFEPETGCPRWQVVDFLWRAADCPEPTLTESPFEDVTPADSFYEAVLWANENKIALGRTATTFDPYGTVNRSEALTFLYRAAGEPEAEEKGEGFADVADNAYYIDAVSWAVSQSEPIAKGIGGNKFAPNSRVIKCDMILFLYRAVEENGIDTTVGAK